MRGKELKTAIVTGASGGIGGAIALKLAEQGYLVFAQYNKNIQAVETLKEKAKACVGEVIPVHFDLTDGMQIEKAYREIVSKSNRINALVNCAGVGLYKLSQQTSEKDWNDLFSINVTGAHLLTSLVLEGMIECKSGKIVNVSSIWGNVGASMEVAYSASKSALIGYTKALAKEVGYSGINVNCVCPGVIDTPMNSRFTKEEIDELIASTPVGRLGKGEDVAEIVEFLLSERADFITGQVITIDGGFTL